MLTVLRIQNLAIIDELEVEFGPGLNVITGETGAGKSILLKALGLLAGGRASPELIRKQSAGSEIEGLFLLGDRDRENMQEFEEELRELVTDDELLIRRVIDGSGRSKLYLNGRLATGAIVQRIAVCLFDMTGQHQQQMLLDPFRHRALVDRFGVDSKLLSLVAERFQEYHRQARALESFERDAFVKTSYFDRLSFEQQELKHAALRLGEKEEIERELSRLENLEEITECLSQTQELMEGEEQSANNMLRRIKQLLTRAVALDESLQGTLELVQTAQVSLEEGGFQLGQYLSGLDADPQRLELLRDRLAELLRLERKYGKSIEGLISYLAQISEELSVYESGEFDLEKLKARCAESKRVLREVETKLTAERQRIGLALSTAVMQELAGVNMPHAAFSTEILTGESTNFGADAVQFFFTANPGQPPLPLAKVASGGELSRVLLILKTLLNEELGASLQVFDEIDVGLGGAVAHVVGEKLKKVGRYSQVIAVTHAPQIAALADAQFVITKEIASGHTRATVRRLNNEDRVREIARMLAGKEVTKEFERSAKELLRLGA